MCELFAGLNKLAEGKRAELEEREISCSGNEWRPNGQAQLAVHRHSKQESVQWATCGGQSAGKNWHWSAHSRLAETETGRDRDCQRPPLAAKQWSPIMCSSSSCAPLECAHRRHSRPAYLVCGSLLEQEEGRVAARWAAPRLLGRPVELHTSGQFHLDHRHTHDTRAPRCKVSSGHCGGTTSWAAALRMRAVRERFIERRPLGTRRARQSVGALCVSSCIRTRRPPASQVQSLSAAGNWLTGQLASRPAPKAGPSDWRARLAGRQMQLPTARSGCLGSARERGCHASRAPLRGCRLEAAVLEPSSWGRSLGAAVVLGPQSRGPKRTTLASRREVLLEAARAAEEGQNARGTMGEHRLLAINQTTFLAAPSTWPSGRSPHANADAHWARELAGAPAGELRVGRYSKEATGRRVRRGERRARARTKTNRSGAGCRAARAPSGQAHTLSAASSPAQANRRPAQTAGPQRRRRS